MNEPRFLDAKSGELTVSLNGRHLHSRFDPIREAERFVSILDNERPRLAIVLGPGLGYSLAAIRRLFPGTRTIALPLVEGLTERSAGKADATWQPGGESIDRFLTRELTDLDAASVVILEWQPVVEAVPHAAEEVRAAVSAHVQRAQASLVTRGASGRRWYRNRLHNYLNVAPVAPAPSSRRIAAVVIAGAGPGLERAIPAIRRARGGIELWATSSALAALSQGDLFPDLVVATDAALYAWEHLRPLIANATASVPVAAPLAATRGLASCPRVAPINEDDPEDEALLGPHRRTIPTVPPQGTVTTTAAGLARRLTTSPIVVAGADFAWLDGRSHARPHLSYSYRAAAATRLDPLTTGVYRELHAHSNLGDGWTTDRTLATYARWFSAQAPVRYAPFSLLAPSPTLAGLPALDGEALAALPRDHAGVDWLPLEWPARDDRRQRLRQRMSELRDIVAGASPPKWHAGFAFDQPAFTHLAESLALPQLLRWYRPAPDREPDSVTRAWDDLRAVLLEEISSLEETFA